MAFGFPPKFVYDKPVTPLSPRLFHALAMETAKALGWNMSQVTENGFIAYTGFSLGSWSEKVTLKIDIATVHIRSECISIQVIDWGKNWRNIRDLIAGINQLGKSLTSEELIQKYPPVMDWFPSPAAD